MISYGSEEDGDGKKLTMTALDGGGLLAHATLPIGSSTLAPGKAAGYAAAGNLVRYCHEVRSCPEFPLLIISISIIILIINIAPEMDGQAQPGPSLPSN